MLEAGPGCEGSVRREEDAWNPYKCFHSLVSQHVVSEFHSQRKHQSHLTGVAAAPALSLLAWGCFLQAAKKNKPSCLRQSGHDPGGSFAVHKSTEMSGNIGICRQEGLTENAEHGHSEGWLGEEGETSCTIYLASVTKFSPSDSPSYSKS